MLYLDNSATTQVLPEVKDAMLPYLLEEFGNPSSKYYSLATNAIEAVKEARQNVASLVGCDPDEVVFTSGATESNNMVIKGVADHYRDKGNHIVTTKVEHPAILEACKYLEQHDYKVTYLDVDQFGRININDFKQVIKEDPPILVSIIWGNNEVGSLNPIKEIAEICKEHDIFFHTDATQVIGKVKFYLFDYPGINFLSGSAHKLHGPKGTGIAIVRKDSLGIPVKITPLIHGGGQERDYRSGTLAVHNIVGFGKAAELAFENITHNVRKLEELESTLSVLLKEKFSDHISFNNDHENKIPGILSVQFKGVNNEVLVKSLAEHIASSTGSACSSSKPSHVLEAMGIKIEEIRSTVRFSISPTTDVQDLYIFKEL